jgi:transposase
MDTSTVIPATDTLGRRIAPRRHRTVDEKTRIVAETRAPGASVAEVARRYAVNANQIFEWRRQCDQGTLGQRTLRGSRLIRVQVNGENAAGAVAAPGITRPASEGRLEITLVDGVRIAVCGDVPAERLEQVLAVLRR